MRALATPIAGLLVIEQTAFSDERGFFIEGWNARDFRDATGLVVEFVQDNHSRSKRHVLRGLHYQNPRAQGKLVRVASGRVFDVTVDLRRGSASFGRWFGIELSDANHRQLWIPAGFAHGFLVMSDVADFLYKVTDYYSPIHEHCLLWNDPRVGVDWPLEAPPVVSAKDAAGDRLDTIERFE